MLCMCGSLLTANSYIHVCIITEQLNQRGYFAALQKLVKLLYEQNDNTKVTLVVHSMGGPVSLYFLTNVVNQEWKDTYIGNYITLAGAWSGSNGGIRTLLSGPPKNAFPKIDFRSLYRTLPSFYYLLPRVSVWNDTAIVITPTRKYTASDYQRLFTDAGYPQGYTQFSGAGMEWPAPNVPTYCFYGLGHPTPMTFVYHGTEFPNAQPTVLNGDGDGTVNQQSSEVCLRWADSSYPFKRTIFHRVEHVAIVSDTSVLQAIGTIVGAPVNPIH